MSPREGSPGWWGAGASDQKEKLRQMVYFNLEKEPLKGGLLAACSYLLGSCREDESRFLREIHSERAKGKDTAWKTGNYS